MRSAFRKVSRVGSLGGGTKWYLSEDCLLAAKRVMYRVEYRRFYLRDLEHILVWPSRLWLWRLMIPAVLLAALGGVFWHWVNSETGEVFFTLALGWVGRELALGPTARARVCITGATIELPLVKRTRRAHKVLAKIDAAVRATRSVMEPPTTPPSVRLPVEHQAQTSSEASASTSIAAATQTNGS